MHLLSTARTVPALAVFALAATAAADGAPEIISFTPESAGAGEIVVIRGSGFGDDPDDLCIMLREEDGDITTFQAIEASDTVVLAMVERVAPDAKPGRIMLERGDGRRGGYAPARANVQNTGGTSWRWLKEYQGGGAAQSDEPFVPVPDGPPPAGQRWFYGSFVDGRVEIEIEGDWVPNTETQIIGRLHRAPGGAPGSSPLTGNFAGYGDFATAQGTFYHAGGNALESAIDLCDHLKSAIEQIGGGPPIKVDCQIVDLPGNRARIVVTLLDQETCEPVPLHGGTLKVCTVVEDPTPWGGIDHYGYYDGESRPAGQVLMVENIGKSGQDGVTLDMNPHAIGIGLQIWLRPLPLFLSGQSFGAAAWGARDGETSVPLGWLEWCIDDNVLAGWTGPDFFGSDTVRCTMWKDDEIVGELEVPAGRLAATAPGASIRGIGVLPTGRPGMYVEFDETVELDFGTTLIELQLLVLHPVAPSYAVDRLQVVDLRGRDLGSFAIVGEDLVGDRCAADVDGNGTVEFDDLLRVLTEWGPVEPCPPFQPADLDLDCNVGFGDVLIILSEWGPCR